MFDKALKIQRKEELKLLKQYKKALRKKTFNGNNIGDVEPKIIKYNNVDYLVEPVWKLVIDNYDEDLDDIEASHKQGLGFSVITSYGDNTEELDLRFANVQDNIELRLKPIIKKICLNSANLKYSYFDGDNDIKYDITVNSDLTDLIISLKDFIQNNINNIESINFQNVNNIILAKLIEKTCFDNNIENITFTNKQNNKKSKLMSKK